MPELPQLYANGKLIGGLATLKSLDDEGKLASTLAPYRLDHIRGRDLNKTTDCEDCGGRRFIVCTECRGTRKGSKQVFSKFLKCAYCNEAGLMACGTCNAAERRQVAEQGEGQTVVTTAPTSEAQHALQQQQEDADVDS